MTCEMILFTDYRLKVLKFEKKNSHYSRHIVNREW